jgi:hypothetical protein
MAPIQFLESDSVDISSVCVDAVQFMVIIIIIIIIMTTNTALSCQVNVTTLQSN